MSTKSDSNNCENFLRYVEEDWYGDFTLYRVVNLNSQNPVSGKIEVIQGGLGFNQHPDVLPPISHKTTNRTDLKHLNGTILMVRYEPCSVNSEIIICMNDQPELYYNSSRNPECLGFAKFRMVKSWMNIIRKIQQSLSDG